MCSHAEESDVGGKLSRMNFPAFHNLLVKPLLDVNLSIERFTSWTSTEISFRLQIDNFQNWPLMERQMKN